MADLTDGADVHEDEDDRYRGPGRRKPSPIRAMNRVPDDAREQALDQPMRVSCGLCGASESGVARELVSWHPEHVRQCPARAA
jgi:hypothetical protein